MVEGTAKAIVMGTAKVKVQGTALDTAEEHFDTIPTLFKRNGQGLL